MGVSCLYALFDVLKKIILFYNLLRLDVVNPMFNGSILL